MWNVDLRPLFWFAMIGFALTWIGAPAAVAAAGYWLLAPRFGWTASVLAVGLWAAAAMAILGAALWSADRLTSWVRGLLLRVATPWLYR